MMMASPTSMRTSSTTPPAPQRRRGRPPIVREFWASESMRRKLIRLYFASNLTEQQICKIFEAVTGVKPISLRSMQKILQQLLFDGQGQSHDHGNKLEHRPALSREEMRRRVTRLRKMKVKRRKMALAKKRRETNSHGSRASMTSTTLSIISESDSELPLFDPVQVQRNLDNNAKMYFKMARQRRRAGESNMQGMHMDSQGQLGARNSNRHTKSLSAILTTFAQSSSPRMMSWCSEVHSLWSDLSLSSLTSSLKSRRSSTMTAAPQLNPDDWPSEMIDATWIPVQPFDSINTFTINSCCRYTDDCMHRRLARTISKQGGEFALTGEDLNDADEAGQTVLHLAARWGASWELLEFLITRVDDISAINCRGETFMHLLRPTELPNFWPRFHPLLQAISARDFRLDTLDCNGQTFFTRLVVQLDKSDHTLVEKYYILEKLLEREEQLLLVLLPITERGGRVASNFVRIFTTLEASLRAKRMHTQAGGALHHILRLQAYAASLPTPPATPPPDSTAASVMSGGSSPTSSVGAYSVGTSSTASSAALPQLPMPLEPASGEANRYDAAGRTPLMHAVLGTATGELAAASAARHIEQLMRAGADPRLQDADGNTALHQAVLAGQTGAVRALLRGGADPSTRNLEGRSAGRMAEEVYRDGGRAGKWKKGIGAYAQRFSTLAVMWNHAAKKEKGAKGN